MPDDFCELSHLGNCGGGLQTHHVLDRGKLNAIPGGRKYCEDKHPEIFLATICAKHNVSRIADSKKARAHLIFKRCNLFGGSYVSGVLDGLRALSKTGVPEWSLEALLPKTRDFQKSRVYAADEEFPDGGMVGFDDAVAYVDKVLRSKWWQKRCAIRKVNVLFKPGIAPVRPTD